MNLMQNIIAKKRALSPETEMINLPKDLSAQGLVQNAPSQVKRSAGQLLKVRNLIGKLFSDANYSKAWKEAVSSVRLMNNDVANEKFGSYNEEFARLHNAVIKAFKNANRNDLAQDFGLAVPVFNEKSHPVDYIATLLKGASNKVSKGRRVKDFSILKPFEMTMRKTLKKAGVTAPPDLPDLTQVFYNTFVAKKGSTYEPLNFAEMLPSELYHVDEAVLNAVVTYVKTLSDKKQSGEVLSPIQDEIATAGIKVQERLTDATKQEINKEVGGFVLSNTWLIIGAVIVVLILVLKK